MKLAEHILLLHDADPIGLALAQRLRERRTPFRELPGYAPVDEIVGAAFGSHAVIAVGDHFVSNPAVLGAAQMPGVGALVLVIRREPDLTSLRKKGVPYTVLRARLLVEEVAAALLPEIEDGRLILGAEDDVPVNALSAEDVAACALAAVSDENSCGRVISLAAPQAMRVSEIAIRVAEAIGRTLKVSKWPRWAIPALRAVKRRSFRLSDQFQSNVASDDPPSLHPEPWQTVEAVATNLARRNDHAMGMQ